MIKEQVQLLLDKPATRREFLGYVGVIALAFVGATAIFRSISQITSHQSGTKRTLHSIITNQVTGGGYGSSKYGS